jgi:hypothetical protein
MGLPLAIATTALSIKGQRDTAKAQAKVQARASEAERQRLLQQMSAKRLEQAQGRIAAAQRIQEAQRASRAALSKSVVSAGEAGVSGVSVDALEGDIQRERAEFIFRTDQQLQFADIATNFALENAQTASTMNQININQPIPAVDYASALAMGLQTGAAAKSLFGSGGGSSSGGSSGGGGGGGGGG